MTSPMRWVIVALYLFAAWQCLRVMRVHTPMAPRECKAWWLIAWVMLLLAVTRLTDWPALVVDFARHYAAGHGWYGMRRALQIEIMLFIAVLAVAGISLLRRREGDLPRPASISLGGLIALLTFDAARAVSLHTVDALLGLSLAGVRLNWLIEIAGIVVILAGALMRVRQGQSAVSR
jgi:hypothetical protein